MAQTTASIKMARHNDDSPSSDEDRSNDEEENERAPSTSSVSTTPTNPSTSIAPYAFTTPSNDEDKVENPMRAEPPSNFTPQHISNETTTTSTTTTTQNSVNTSCNPPRRVAASSPSRLLFTSYIGTDLVVVKESLLARLPSPAMLVYWKR